jgi:hypothetical protein
MIGFTDAFFYNQLQQITIDLLPNTRSMSQFSYTFWTQLLNWLSVLAWPSSIISLLWGLATFSFSDIIFLQFLNSTTELTEPSQVFFRYNLWKDRIEIISKSSSIIMCFSVAAESCLVSRCLAMVVSMVLLWLHISGVQSSCHSIILYSNQKYTI